MKVKEIMTTNVKTCELNESLAAAANAMWNYDCGILPVLKDGIELAGIITDRDICMGAAMRDRTLADISVEEILKGHPILSVTEDDEVPHALETMRQHRIRRLPVVDASGTLTGMLSMNDVVLKASEKKKPGVSYGDVVQTYQAICQHPQPKAEVASAT